MCEKQVVQETSSKRRIMMRIEATLAALRRYGVLQILVFVLPRFFLSSAASSTTLTSFYVMFCMFYLYFKSVNC